MKDSLRGKHYKYIHLFWVPEIKFSVKLMEAIHNEATVFVAAEHHVVTPSQRVFDAMKEYPNVTYIPCQKLQCAKLANLCLKHCDWLILHSLCEPHEVLKLRGRQCKKIIWRTWGHDVAKYQLDKSHSLKNEIRKIIARTYSKRIRSFAAVGIANAVDELAIEKAFGKLPLFCLAYMGFSSESVLKKVKAAGAVRNDDFLHVMIGHSGYPNDQHIEIAERLKLYANEKMYVYFSLAYGDKVYIENVKKYVQENWGERGIILDSFMPYDEYMSFLNRMDIAILDSPKSYALGNISSLLYFGKKIVLNRNGVIKDAFDHDKLPFMCSDELGIVDFKTFSDPFNYPEDIKSSLFPGGRERAAENWKALFSYLEQLSHKNSKDKQEVPVSQ